MSQVDGRVISASQGEDDAALASCAAQITDVSSVFDMTAGGGACLRTLAACRPDLHLSGMDLRPPSHRNHGDQFEIARGDIFYEPWPAADLFISNPPLAPGEMGFSSDGTDEYFSCRLLRRALLHVDRPKIMLNHFGYLGVDSPVGGFPAIAQVARQCGYSVTVCLEGWRRIPTTSRLRARLNAITQVAPGAQINLDGREVELADAVDLIAESSVLLTSQYILLFNKE